MEESRLTRLKNWLSGPFFPLYTVYFTASWGRRMWSFSLGLFLVTLAGDDVLLLTAIFGFSMGISVLLFGGLIGRWIDKKNRLTVVRTTILINKLSVCLCTVTICLILHYGERIDAIWGGGLRKLCQAGVISLAIIVDLANMAYKFIAIEKDWFVVVTAGDSGSLANLNAFTRSIDLCANILAPIVTGQVMTYGSKLHAGVFIVCWHVMAIVVEYSLLRRVYRLVPGLTKKKVDKKDGKSKELEHLRTTDDEKAEESRQDIPIIEKSCCASVCDRIMIPFRGWKVYMEQPVKFGGLSLAFLYFTVLGFDGITTGYIYANGISESIVGISLAVASLAGVVGAFLFTRFRQCIGLLRTGQLAFVIDLSCLSLCILSIWAPGSPFNATSLFGDPGLDVVHQQATNCSQVIGNSSLPVGMNITSSPCSPIEAEENSIMSVSIIMFLVGIICSRVGLWMVDLVVSQLFQEQVPEAQRGIVNGVQNSLNQLMDMLKFTLVMVLPKLHTFGFLILLSFFFIFLGSLLFSVQAYRSSGRSVARCIRGQAEGDGPKRNSVLDSDAVEA